MYEVEHSDVTTMPSVRSISLLIKAHNNINPLVLGQFILIPNKINEFIYLKGNA
jgi:hypothetical protein